MEFYEKWNSVKDKLPTDNGKYIVAIKVSDDITDIKTTYFLSSINEFIVKDSEKVTHWKPLPKLPTIE